MSVITIKLVSQQLRTFDLSQTIRDLVIKRQSLTMLFGYGLNTFYFKLKPDYLTCD